MSMATSPSSNGSTTNCPYCRKLDPELRQVVQDDGKVRLVLKDWPILGPVSKVAARMALAGKYQDKFLKAHEAMIGVASKLTEPRIGELLTGAGVDMDRLNRDLVTNAKAIDAILARNNDQAKAFGFNGHAVLHRRQIPRARRPDHGPVRAWSLPTRARRRRAINALQSQKRPRQRRGRPDLMLNRRDYFDEIFTQSSWARPFSACQSDAATSQLTMVRLVCATWPLATRRRLHRIIDVDAADQQQRAQNHSEKRLHGNLR